MTTEDALHHSAARNGQQAPGLSDGGGIVPSQPTPAAARPRAHSRFGGAPVEVER